MKSYTVFLRGINVNGIQIKMADLKAVIESLGYKDVKTTLASGNVSFMTDKDCSDTEHIRIIEKGLEEAFNYEAFVVLMKKTTLNVIVSEIEKMTIPKDYNHYILLSNEHKIEELLSDLFNTCNVSNGERLIVSEKAIYWIVKKGETLKTDFGKKILGSKKYKSILTSRSVGTLRKIACR